jgi:hypothetical protein
MRSGQALPLDYVPRPALHNRSSNLAVFSLLTSTISLCSEQTFYLAMRMSEGGVVSETRNPFASFHLRMESLSHSEWLWCDTSGQSKTPGSQRAAAFGWLSSNEDQASSRSGGDDPQ